MPRPQQRACLQDGLKLDLNGMIRRGHLRRNTVTPAAIIRWTSNYWGEVANGLISADMRDDHFGWFKIQLGKHSPQHIHLRAVPRHYGGHQWYFICPTTGRQVSTLWRPPGATRFASREAWGKYHVAYRTQFLDRSGRAHHAKAALKSRLCEIGGFDPDEWDFPPPPKRMREKTYARLEAKYDHQEEILDRAIDAAVSRLIACEKVQQNQ